MNETYLQALEALDLKPHSRITASLLGSKLRTIQRYADGTREVPEPVMLLIEMYLRHGLPDYGDTTSLTRHISARSPKA